MTKAHFHEGAFEEALRSLDENGFCVISGYMSPSDIPVLSKAYDAAVANASEKNIHKGRSSTRVEGLLDTDPIFHSVYKAEILHAAARQLIGGAFKLSCFH